MRNTLNFVREHSLPQTGNMVKYKISKQRQSTYLRYYPLHLIILITSKCTQKCNMCPQKKPNRYIDSFKFDDISFGNFKMILNKFKYAVKLDLTGGEPFLHKDVFDMIEFGNKNKMSVEISTNGTILNDKIDQIINSSLSSLNISLDAHNPSAYEKMHGDSKQVFDTVIKNITELVERRNWFNKNLELQISYICTKANYKNIPDMVRLAEDLKVDILNFCNLVSFGISGFSDDKCLYEDNSDVVDVIESLDPPKSKLIVHMPKLYKRTTVDRYCKFPFTTLTLDSNGNVSTCCAISPHRDYGNVFYHEDVWNNRHFQTMRGILFEKSFPLPGLCKTCNNRFPESDRITLVVTRNEQKNYFSENNYDLR